MHIDISDVFFYENKDITFNYYSAFRPIEDIQKIISRLFYSKQSHTVYMFVFLLNPLIFETKLKKTFKLVINI